MKKISFQMTRPRIKDYRNSSLRKIRKSSNSAHDRVRRISTSGQKSDVRRIQRIRTKFLSIPLIHIKLRTELFSTVQYCSTVDL